MEPHIKKLFDEVDSVKYDSKEYWKLRCVYREKMEDKTYSEYERNNCFNLWAKLIDKYASTYTV